VSANANAFLIPVLLGAWLWRDRHPLVAGALVAIAAAVKLSPALLVVYFLCCAATVVLQRRHVGEDQAPFRLVGGPIIPILAMALVAALATTLTRREIIAVGIAFVFAAVTYLVSRNPKPV
ncbi:MAG: glycosyltransferase 87 family protein, partial [Gemmatimonadota bacterium]